ncbi:MAG: IS200/IS605 family transposase [Candidatus Zixiibacteriota bacterium]
MPYIRVWIHLIWSTKNRTPILKKELRNQVIEHIKENAGKKDIYLDSVNGVCDHVHALVSIKADQSIAKVTQLLKGESSHWVNSESFIPGKFEWQDEYIAISVSESMVDKVREYIDNQEEYHRKKTFAEEYQEFIKKYGFAVSSTDTR